MRPYAFPGHLAKGIPSLSKVIPTTESFSGPPVWDAANYDNYNTMMTTYLSISPGATPPAAPRWADAL